jgi:hypothetical protein
MKHLFKLFGIIAFVAIIGFSIVSCGDKGGDEDVTPDIASFNGTWNASSGRVIVFSGNTFNYKVNNVTQYSGTFSVSGSTITFNESSLGSASGNFSLSENTLVLSNHTWDSSVNGTYTKDSGGTNNFVGTWTQDGSGGSVKVVLTQTNWTATYNNATYNAGTYTYDGTTATWTVTNKGQGSANVGATGNATIQSNGKMVVANFADSAMNGTYTKN